MSIFAGPEISESGLTLYLDASNPKNFDLTSVEVLVVAGGGGGGCGESNVNGGGGGGGGAGGLIYNSSFSVTPGTSLTVTVGGGGNSSSTSTTAGNNGGNSVFGSLTAIGGGGGGGGDFEGTNAGATGGSGGGAGGDGGNGPTIFSAGTANQGFAGGARNGTINRAGAGGGGAGGPGNSGRQGTNTTGLGGSGGPGLVYDISGTPTYYAGGGGGGASLNFSSGVANSSGGIGGGGAGGGATQGANGTANTGGGGGGGYGTGSGAGGSGIVIVRYPGPQRAIGGTVTSVGGFTIHTFTTVGSSTFTPLVATNNSSILGIADISGNGNFGTSINSPIYNNSNGGNLTFNGTNQYISVANSSSINPNTGSFTIIVWANSDPSNGGDGWDLWVAKRSNGNNGYYVGANNPLGVKFMIGNDANSRTDTGFITYTYNTWAMYTAILDRTANTQTIIKNNYEETSSATPSGGNYSNTGALSIGGDIGINAYYVNGKVSIVQMYNRALTTSEVGQIFNAFRGRFGI